MLLQKGNILFPAITAAAGLGEGVRPHLFKRGVEDSTKCPGGYVLAHIHTGYLYDAWKCATITVREQQPGGSGA